MGYREMRRKDRQMSNEDSIRILNNTFFGTISLMDGDRPYGVMMSHAYKDGKLYFHCATSGYKLDIIKANPKCCYTAVLEPEFLKKKATIRYESICAFGTIKVADAAEKIAGYKVFNDHYLGDMPEFVAKSMKASAAKSEILIMDIDYMTGKSND